MEQRKRQGARAPDISAFNGEHGTGRYGADNARAHTQHEGINHASNGRHKRVDSFTLYMMCETRNRSAGEALRARFTLAEQWIRSTKCIDGRAGYR